MFTCPECGEHNVRIYRMVPMIEDWYGDDVESEEDLSDRGPDTGTIECHECGYMEEDIDILAWCDD